MSTDTPRPGDIVITQRASDGRFEISSVSGRPQLTTPNRHDAIAQAQAFAAHTGASVWFTESGVRFVRITRGAES